MKKAGRVVVKVGTSSITREGFDFNHKKIGSLVNQIHELVSGGVEVILVSSGAVAAGINKLGLKQRPRDVNVLQACAAIGQNRLMAVWGRKFRGKNLLVAQVLLTADDFRNRTRYLNARNTILELLKRGVIPLVNENDSVSVDEIRVGDNDNLSAQVAANLEADLLIMLSNTDGLYSDDPSKNPDAQKISVVDKITPKLKKLRGKSRSGGVGGIASKVSAAKIAVNSNINTILADSSEKNILLKAVCGQPVGTLFLAKKKMDSKLHWLVYSSKPKGRVKVDLGAKKALLSGGCSLLPSGVTGVEGSFKKGESVCLVGPGGEEFACGITNYSSSEIAKIKGRHTKEIEGILGKRSYKDIIYCGNMVVK